jgi:DNA-binding transcriptional LysR family regulator
LSNTDEGEFMDFSEIECFIEVCNQMSFTRAGKKLFLSQQGVSKKINKLEEELDVVLFNRTSSTIQLTEYGELFLPNAKLMYDDYQNAMKQLLIVKKRKAGELSIGIPNGLVNFFPQQILDNFITIHPDINIMIYQYNDVDCEEALLKEKIDIGFCVAPVDEEIFAIHHMHREKTYFMLSEKHRLANCDVIRMEQMRNEKFVGFGEGNKGHNTLNDKCLNAGFPLRMLLVTLDMQLIIEMCRNNMAVGFYVGPTDKTIPGIRLIPSANLDWDWNICITTLKNRKMRNIDKDFIEKVKKW